MSAIRPAALAGTWYEAQPESLAARIDSWLAQARAKGPVRNPLAMPVAVVAPHAGYTYSGEVAAAVYGLLPRGQVRRVVVVGPSHYLSFPGYAVPTHRAFRTPLGDVAVDRAAVEYLAAQPLARMDDRAHTPEHSIEIQLPILQRALGEFQLVPVIAGDLDPGQTQVLARALSALQSPGTVFVASTDFTHRGERFGYEPLEAVPPQDRAAALRDLDLGLAERVLALDVDEYEAYRGRTGITACGHRPMAAMMHVLKGVAGVRGRLVDYETSAGVTGDWSSTVSYVGLLFEAPAASDSLAQGGETASPELNAAEGRVLLGLARWAVREWLATGRRPRALPAGIELTPCMREKRGAFVTLRKHGELRGCIGHVTPVLPLAEAVVSNAVNAASKDPRFEPLERAEEPEISIEVSVLSPLEEIRSVDEIQIGRDGLEMEYQGARGVLLPQVAVEMGLDPVGFLEVLCRKARVPSGAWREQDCRVWRFGAQIFEE